MAAATSPELSVDSVNVVDGEYQVGDSVDIMAKLTNSGDGVTGAFTVTFKATSESDDIVELGAFAVTSIAAGVSMNINTSFELPAGMATGLWSISAVRDSSSRYFPNSILS